MSGSTSIETTCSLVSSAPPPISVTPEGIRYSVSVKGLGRGAPEGGREVERCGRVRSRTLVNVSVRPRRLGEVSLAGNESFGCGADSCRVGRAVLVGEVGRWDVEQEVTRIGEEALGRGH